MIDSIRKMRILIAASVEIVTTTVAFFRAGYPQGVPEADYIPVLALLDRRLTDDEVGLVVDELVRIEEGRFDIADIGVAITRITDALPSLDELERVHRRLTETLGEPADRED